LSRSVELGFRDMEWMKQDTDLTSVHAEQAFTALMARIPTLRVTDTERERWGFPPLTEIPQSM
jgi:hypothetical protein